jgi:putative Ca2+/H+ antiporter (TMEM165/GDT1 family)
MISSPADGALAAFGSSVTAITLAELGDKTFFMALILAARLRPRWGFIGSFAGLAAVTLISLGLGYGLRELLPTAVMLWLATVLFLGFGLRLLLAAQRMSADSANEEAAEAEETVHLAEARVPVRTPEQVIREAFVLVFLAELGAGHPLHHLLPGHGPCLHLRRPAGRHAAGPCPGHLAGGWRRPLNRRPPQGAPGLPAQRRPVPGVRPVSLGQALG